MNIPRAEQATYISIATPFMAVGLSCCGNPAHSLRPMGAGDVTAEVVIFSLFALLGLGCGLYGAFSFRDHGSYGIVIGCIVGMLLNGVILTLVALAVFAVIRREVGA